MIVAVGLGIVFAAAQLTPMVLSGSAGRPPSVGGTGSWFSGGMTGMMAAAGQPASIQQSIQAMQSPPPPYARVTRSNDTVAFDSQNIDVLVLAMIPDRAANLTGMQPPSYSTGDVFVIYGLVNPTLVIPKGTSIHFTIANLDDDMYHNMVVSSIGPPYPYMSMEGGMMSSFWQGGGKGSASLPVLSMMPFLPPADYRQGSAYEYSYALTFNQPGNLWYLCTYPGHALQGMYGEILVTG